MDRFKPLGSSKARNEALVIVLLVLVLIASLPIFRPAQAADEPLALQLEVLLNGQPTKMIGTFSDLGGGRIAATGATLADLGFKAGSSLAPEETIPLDELPGVTYAYDEAAQSIDIVVVDEERNARIVDVSGQLRKSYEASDDVGGAVNYALHGSTGEHLDDFEIDYGGASLTLEGRVFGPLGLLTTDGILKQGSDGHSEAIRLATTWSYSDTDNLTTYRAGDIITGGLAWTRPVRLAGGQIDRNFGLRPGLVTMPLPTLGGSAVVPSTVDVYVNASKAYSGQVAGGPFEVQNIPAVTGAGTARVVIRDASGREQEITTDFYASSSLLREGLFDYSAEAGVLRLGFGSDDDRYDDQLAGSASLRYGLTDDITIEAHAEATNGLLNGGAGVVANLADIAIVSLAAATSTSDEGQGAQVHASLETEIGKLSLRGATTRTFGDYADLGSISFRSGDDDPDLPPPLVRLFSREVPRAIDRISAGAPLPFELGTLGLSYTHIDRVDDPEVHLASATYSRALFYDISLYTSAFHDFGVERSSGVYAGLSMPLGDYGTLSSGVKHDKNGTGYSLSSSKSLAEAPGSYGWYASTDDGEDQTSTAASLSYRSSVATGTVRARSHATGTAASAELAGSIAATQDGVFLANRIDDGFAVVDAGAEGVPIMLENRRVAVTDSSGTALVTGLRAYEPNKISIDAVDVPLGTEITETEHVAVPRERAGVRVLFNAKSTSGTALVILKLADGGYPPPGSKVVLDGSDADYVAGYDGQVYLEGLTGEHRLAVSLDGSQCHASFTYAPSEDNFTTIDPVICR
ncbi:MAG: fimbria/pilus outer membrane usher protein [Hyphomicrobiaceae bacterium]